MRARGIPAPGAQRAHLYTGKGPEMLDGGAFTSAAVCWREPDACGVDRLASPGGSGHGTAVPAAGWPGGTDAGAVSS